MTETVVNLSDFLNRPKETLRKLQLSPDQALRVHRRAADEDDLLVLTNTRAEQARQASSASAAVLAVLLRHSPESRSALHDAAPKVFPWARFLPPEELEQFVIELVDTFEAADSIGNPAPVSHLIAAWKNTAQIYADPDLHAILSQDGADLGPVPEPPTVP